MTPIETASLIAAVGGDTAFGKLLGIHTQPGYQQRINNWKRRGMPHSVVLEHYEVIKRLQAQAAEPQRAAS